EDAEVVRCLLNTLLGRITEAVAVFDVPADSALRERDAQRIAVVVIDDVVELSETESARPERGNESLCRPAERIDLGPVAPHRGPLELWTTRIGRDARKRVEAALNRADRVRRRDAELLVRRVVRVTGCDAQLVELARDVSVRIEERLGRDVKAG